MNITYANGFCRLSVSYVSIWLLLICNLPGWAQMLPDGFSMNQIAASLSTPTAMAFAPDGRLFITEQGGSVRIFKDGALVETPFAQLHVDSYGERGLDGIAIDPNFATNSYIYLYYTVPDSPAHNRVSRFTANGDVVEPGSELVLLDLEPPLYGEFHNGGSMHFGPDGKLYIGIGDHANGLSAQNPDSHHGKVLRINSDGSLPSDNPYTTGSETRQSVWALGLRNPFTFAFQPGSGRLFINDVGYLDWEEINEATQPGRNFGWPNAEGRNSGGSFDNPLYTYAHGMGDSVGCAITGGTFFNPSSTNYPAHWTGNYFFHDYCNQWINYLDLSGSEPVRGTFATGIPASPLGICVGPDGNLYFLTRDSGQLYKITYTNTLSPTITSQPISVSAFEGQPATFRVEVSGATPLSFQWQYDNEDIPGANQATYSIPIASSATAGTYQVLVSNGYGSVTSTQATLTDLGFNAPPQARILSPSNHTLYQAGTTVAFSGSATDAEDGAMPASAFSWRVYLHHNTHRHDGPPIATGATSGTFTIPRQGETSTNVWYRLILTVTDSKGLVGRDSIDLDPTIVTLNLATNPSGLQINLDGHTHTTPYSQSFVAGLIVNLSTPVTQFLGETAYEFTNWSPAVQAAGTIEIPATGVTHTASFSVLPDGPRVFTLTAPLYNCQTGAITFQTSGGDGSVIEYMAIGITGWTTNPNHIIEEELRRDPSVITLHARQNGVEVSRAFDMLAFCTNRAPTVQASLPSLTATTGENFSYQIPANTFADPESGSITITAANVPDGLAFNSLTRTLSGTITQAGVTVIDITATDDQGATVTTTLNITVTSAVTVTNCSAVGSGESGPEITSVAAGEWSSPSTWSCHCVPGACNPVRINHAVTILNNTTATARNLVYGAEGRLIISTLSLLQLGN